MTRRRWYCVTNTVTGCLHTLSLSAAQALFWAGTDGAPRDPALRATVKANVCHISGQRLPVRR